MRRVLAHDRVPWPASLAEEEREIATALRRLVLEQREIIARLEAELESMRRAPADRRLRAVGGVR